MVQNGCHHILSRDDVLETTAQLPQRLKKNIHSIALYQGEDELEISYHSKEGILGLYCPSDHSNISKSDAQELLVIAFLCIDETGDWPSKLTRNRYESYREDAKNELYG